MFKSSLSQLPNASHDEIVAEARREYHRIQKRTPRRVPYVRSKHFNKQKVFINNFWEHLQLKSPPDKRRRLKLFACAIDLIRNTTDEPVRIKRSAHSREIFYRFEGETFDGVRFQVQVKESSKTGRKDFISVFPTD